MLIHHDRETVLMRMKEMEDECREVSFARKIRQSRRQPRKER
ncbi:hypothetical protein [Alteribacter natronophilus]|nr:hypothetical protein [Alteribacter natronophilus]